MKVLLVLPEFPPDYGGGIVTFYRDLVPALRSVGCEVSVLKGSAFLHGEDTYESDGTRVDVLRSELFRKWGARFAHFAMFPELRRHLAAAFAIHEQAKSGDGFDVIEVTDWGFLFLPWIIGAEARVLVQLHGSSGQILYHEPVVHRQAERAFSLLLEKAGLGVAPGLTSYSRANVHWWESVIGQQVDFLPPPLTSPVPAGVGGVHEGKWLTVGRIQQWKGPQVVCAAWEMMGSAAPQLEWVGRDTQYGENGLSTDAHLRAEFPSIWGKAIVPLGQMSPARVAAQIQTAKVVVVPSTWDVFNFVAAEAMAFGKPVVISNGAGASDLIDHGVNGFAFPNGNAKALVEVIGHLETLDSRRLREVGLAAALTVHERLNPLRIAEGKLALYRRLPSGSPHQNLWMREWLSPATGRNPLGFLHSLPLKDLGKYVMRRMITKVWGSVAS